ncbi:MAG TPA: CoA transferase [Caulobacteraceae bacterium]|jgi:formyl-CoA transferase
MANEVPAGPLDGLKVIEMGQLIAGPFCGQLLGDLGADVVKIEAPGVGDPARVWGLPGYPLHWEVLGRNKRCVSCDLRQAEGQALARRLIAGADILIENFRPGTLERWNLAPADLRAADRRLIVVRMSGYGQTGPYSDRAGYGGIGEAMGGWRRIVGDPDRPPSRMGVSIGDALAATYGALGALAALAWREKTGEGQIVDSALYEAVLQVMESLVPDWQVAGHERGRTGSILPRIAPSNVYRCADGDFLIAANQDTVFVRLADAIGAPALATDPRFATHGARGDRQGELDELIEAWTSTRSVAEVEAAMSAAGVPAGKIYTPADMLADPQFKARESLVEVDHPRWGRLVMQNVFPRLSATPGSIRRIASQAVGSDNADVYGERLGLTASDLTDLQRRGVI